MQSKIKIFPLSLGSSTQVETSFEGWTLNNKVKIISFKVTETRIVVLYQDEKDYSKKKAESGAWPYDET
jgi:hypothetical protein